MWFFVVLVTLVICVAWWNQVTTRRSHRIRSDANALKKWARPNGSFFESPYVSRQDFLDYMGQFFKYKKHEWIFIALMRGRKVDQFWVNKGPDNECVGPFLGMPHLAAMCQENGYDHVLVWPQPSLRGLGPVKARSVVPRGIPRFACPNQHFSRTSGVCCRSVAQV